MRIHANLISAIVLVLCVAESAGAYLSSVQPLDQLADTANVIIKVTASDLKAFDSSPEIDSFPEEQRFAFVAGLLYVLKTDHREIPDKQVLETYGTVSAPWDSAHAEDRTLLLFLERGDAGRLQIINDVHAIIPVSGTPTLQVPNPEQPHKGLFEEFNRAAKAGREVVEKAEYISYMAPLATQDDLPIIDQYAVDSNSVIKLSSALASAQVNPNPLRIQTVVDELKLQTPTDTALMQSLFNRLFNDVEMVARCRSIRMEEAMTSRARAYLPIYRYFIDHDENDCVKSKMGCPGVSMSIEALAAVGTRDDLMRLWRFHEAARDYDRHECLEGLARILECPTKRPPITSYGFDVKLSDEVLEWEARALGTVQKLMTAQGLLK